ncbi:MAG: MBL fold metallo-hydrolase [Chloroflexi bacterium]|nr:MBL fold metallo-hydrolase [Chloroflexota bacterium]
MKHVKYLILFVLSLVILLTACAPAAVDAIVVTATLDPMSTPKVIEVTATPSPTSTPGPDVTVYYEGFAQFELISPTGRRVLIDVHDPDRLSSPPTEDDILLTTHRDSDHYVSNFARSFPGQKILSEVGEISLPDVTIQGIASAHSAGEVLVPQGGSNYIFIIDMAGMRFAHFGDIGQEELSQEQLDALGDVDVAMILLGGMCSASQDNSFGLIEQVQPQLIIPTHTAMPGLERGVEMWDAYCGDPWIYTEDISGISIKPADLSGEIKFLMLGEWGVACKGKFDLPTW